MLAPTIKWALPSREQPTILEDGGTQKARKWLRVSKSGGGYRRFIGMIGAKKFQVSENGRKISMVLVRAPPGEDRPPVTDSVSSPDIRDRQLFLCVGDVLIQSGVSSTLRYARRRTLNVALQVCFELLVMAEDMSVAVDKNF
jgi:hypothetical protein